MHVVPRLQPASAESPESYAYAAAGVPELIIGLDASPQTISK